MSDIPADSLRLDIWLWRARFFKTRALAARQVEKGRMRLETAGQTRRVSKPAAAVRPGDRLTLSWNKSIVRLEIRSLGERRGPAPEARALYDLLPEDDGNPD